MKAAYYHGINKINLENVEIPEISDNEILIKVKAAAICGTDLRIYKFGHFKIKEGLKRVLGHEFSGIVEKVGKNIENIEVGERVAVPPNVGCGHCNMCLNGYNQLCKDYEAFGISYDGGFQEYVKIPAIAINNGNVIKIPDEMDFVTASLVEPFSCAYNSYKNLKTVPGDSVLIIGSGPIGACHVMINKLAGATKIIVADISDTRLLEIKKFGVDILINSSKENLVEKVMEITNNLGVDIVITACSVPEVQNLALEVSAVHGRINFFGGMPKGKENVTLNTNLIHYKELTALGTTGSSIKDYIESINIANSKKINLKELATGIFNIDNINDAFEYSLLGKGMKSVIVVE